MEGPGYGWVESESVSHVVHFCWLNNNQTFTFLAMHTEIRNCKLSNYVMYSRAVISYSKNCACLFLLIFSGTVLLWPEEGAIE